MSTLEQIKQVIEELASLKNIQSHLKALHDQIKEEETRLLELDKAVDQQLKDFESLQKLSVKGLFYKVLGNKEEQLEKERQEYLKVNLEYKDAKESLELLEYEKGVIEQKVGDIEALKSRLEALKKKREEEILLNPGPVQTALKKLYDQMDQINFLQKEISEAIQAGVRAEQETGQVLSHLNNAIKWGQWDMMNSKSRYYDHMKHSAVDRAMDTAYRAKKSLRVFQQELKDIDDTDYDLHIDVEESGRFMDIFFDNLISDWIVQNKIKNVKSNVSAVHDKVRLILATLENDVNKLNQDRNSIENQKDELLTS